MGWQAALIISVLSLITSLAFGLAPALSASRHDLAGTIKTGGKRSVGTANARVRNVLPDGELSLADLATHAPAALRPGLTQLAGYWKTKDAMNFLPTVATTADAKPELRVAAIEALRHLTSTGRRGFAVLGYMAELGDLADSSHQEVGRLAAQAGVTGLVAVPSALRSP